jgi:hypothetical protein
MMYKNLYFHGYGGSYFIFSAMGFGRFWVWVCIFRAGVLGFWVCDGSLGTFMGKIWMENASGGVVLGKGNGCYHYSYGWYRRTPDASP